jgi:hypothetical protein
MRRCLACAAFAVLCAAASPSWAGVAGKQFSTEFSSNQRGTFLAQMEFNSEGKVWVNNDSQPDVSGPYTALGTIATLVQAHVAPDEPAPYEALYYALSLDLKEIPVPLIQVLFANTPASIFGVGIGTDFEILVFTGVENLVPVVEPEPEPEPEPRQRPRRR